MDMKPPRAAPIGNERTDISVAGSLIGMLAAFFLVELIAGLVGAAIGPIGYQTGLSGRPTALSVAALAGGSAALLLSFGVGGWAAARIARRNGGANGLMTGVWALGLSGAFALLGAILGPGYDVFQSVQYLPTWFARDALTGAGVTSAAGAIVAMLLGGGLGGLIGVRDRRPVDETGARSRSTAMTNQEQVVTL